MMRYLYPPRPELKISPSSLIEYDNGKFLAEPKLNGSCCPISINGSVKAFNRHDETISGFRITYDEIKSVVGEGEYYLIGEYMNKSKKDENNNIFNHKLVLFDILVYQGEYLLGKTFQERYDMLLKMFKPISETKYLYQLTENIYLVKSFYNNLTEVWNEIVEIDMFEGLVLKQKISKLEPGYRELNNTKSQVKCRKPTKNYKY
jgi:ATP-dependent DNA ligase